MKRPALLLCAALLLGHAASCWSQPGGFQRLTIPDNNGYERPIPAFTVEVPTGWQGQGAVFWDANTPCTQIVPSMHWQARSPDGALSFELLPRWASQVPDPVIGPTMNGCPSMPITSIRGYLEHLARQRHPHGRILDYRDRPDRLAKVQLPPPLSVPGAQVQFRNWAEAGEILIGWVENGRQMREALTVSGLFMEMRTTLPLTGPSRSLTLNTGAAAALRAPDGRLDLNLFSRMLDSLQADANWQARLNQHEAQKAQIALKGSRERAQIAARGNAEAARIRNQTWENQQKSQDTAHARYIDSIRGVQPHRDPHSGNTVELSNLYDHSWHLSNGSYYQTNDPGFNPYLELGVDGERMDPVDY